MSQNHDIRNFFKQNPNSQPVKPNKLNTILSKYTTNPITESPFEIPTPTDKKPSQNYKKTNPNPKNLKPRQNNLIKNYSFADILQWTMNKFPWDSDLDVLRRDIFGISNYRQNQKGVINATKSNRDVFVCMPTGGGKSLCFQLPAITEKGFTLVVMPLLALIYDQTSHLESIGIKALSLSSHNNISQNALFEIFDKVDEKELPKMLYISPEKIEKTAWFMDFLFYCDKKQLLNRIVIDEAHCVSQWGRDFRPDYLTLGKLKYAFPKVPIMALTATATEIVRIDIVKSLNMVNCLYFQSSFNRPNLFYEVREKEAESKVLSDIAYFIKTNYNRQCGIIYCITTKEAEKVADRLKSEHGLSAVAYHAKITEKQRYRIQDDWMVDDINIIVATIAFGMGINKPNVRFVIHYSLPKSLENYYQESGRAGRDGKQSHCLIYYRFYDRMMLYFLMKEKMSKEAKAGIYKMISFCEELEVCRRKLQLEHFSEKFDEKKCLEMCDNCKDKREFLLKDCTNEAICVVEEIIRGKRLTYLQICEILSGKQKRKRNFGTPLSGLLKDWKYKDIDTFVKELLFKDFIYEALVNTHGHINAYVSGYKNNKNLMMLRDGKACFYIKIALPKIKKIIMKDFDKEEKVVRKDVNGQPIVITEYNFQRRNEENKEKKNKEPAIVKSGFSNYLKSKELLTKTPPEDPLTRQSSLKLETVKYENTGRIFIRQGSTDDKLLEPYKQTIIKPKKLFHSEYGYCDEEQYNEIYERLLLVRKKIYNLKKIKAEGTEDKVINIDNMFPLTGLEELSRKLPTSESELTVDNIKSVGVLPLKLHGKAFLEEIKHFIKMQEIKKEDYIVQLVETADSKDEIFNMEENIIKRTETEIEQEEESLETEQTDEKDQAATEGNGSFLDKEDNLSDYNDENNFNDDDENCNEDKYHKEKNKNNKNNNDDHNNNANNDSFEGLDLDQVDEVIREYEKQQSSQNNDNIKKKNIVINPEKDEFDDFFFKDMMSLEFQQISKISPIKLAPAEKNFKRKPNLIEKDEKFEENKPKKIFEEQDMFGKGPFKKLTKQIDFL